MTHFCRAVLLTVSILTMSLSAAGQGEANWWFFGSYAGVHFDNGTVTAVNGSMSQYEGVASISDADGNLLFYTSGIDVWDKNDVQMPNGFGLWGDPSSTQSGVIVRKPGSTTEYYLFTVGAQIGFYSGGFGGVSYSIVDMSLNGGNGDVIDASKNTVLVDSTAEKITAVRHCNGQDIWIITHKWNSNAFYAYLLTPAGVDPTPVISNIGSVYMEQGSGNNSESIGYLKASPQGDRLASCIWHVPNNDVEVFDFDKATGVVSNLLALPTGGWAYGCSFSPDGSKLYAGFVDMNYMNGYSLVEWDLSAPDVPSTLTVIDPNVMSWKGGLQLGPDGKIYVAVSQAMALDIIGNPNGMGAGAGFLPGGLPLTNTCNFGLPNFLDSYIIQVPNDAIHITTNGCQLPTTLSATAGFDAYLWSTGETTASIDVTLPGSYWVQGMTINCDSMVYADTVLVLGADPFDILGNDTAICSDASLTLNASGGVTYLWSNGATVSNINVTTAGSYSVSVTTSAGCTESDTIEVSVSPSPQIDALVTETSCGNPSGTIDLTITGGTAPFEFVWTGGLTGEDQSALEAGDYNVTVTDAQECSATAVYTVTSPLLPNVTLSGTDETCNDANGLVDATASDGLPPYTFSWSNGATVEDPSGLSAGTYSVTVMDQNGCEAIDSISIGALGATPFSLGNDTAVCAGESVLLNMSVAGSYAWQDGATGSTYLVTEAGAYSVTVTNANACTSTDSVIITVWDLPLVTLINDTTVCEGETVLLDAGNAGAAFIWSNGTALQTLTITTAGNFSVTVTDINGCTATDQSTIATESIPVINLGNDTTICEQTSVELGHVVTNATYQWNDGSTAATIFASAAGTYSVTVFTPLGCSAADDVVASTLPVVDVFIGNDTTICQGQVVTLNAGAPAGIPVLWNNGKTTPSIEVAQNGLYWLTAGTGACAAHDTIVITVQPLPSPDLGLDTFICPGNELVVNAGYPGATFVWSTGETTQSIIVNNAPLSLWVQVTEGLCSATDDLVVYNECDIYIPNAFSPNNDGQNDLFRVRYDALVEYRMSIYNRWGEQVYVGDNPDSGWDGTYRNMPCGVGTFVYAVEYVVPNDATRYVKKGNVTLLR